MKKEIRPYGKNKWTPEFRAEYMRRYHIANKDALDRRWRYRDLLRRIARTELKLKRELAEKEALENEKE